MDKMKDELGDRMKSFYKDRTRTKLPRRSYTIIRIDGKAFHTYTKGLERPFDMWLMEDNARTETPAGVTDTTVVIPESSIYKRNGWEADPETPIFTQDREYLRSFFPNYEQQKEEENV
jgi:hypothetical protein